MTLARDTMQPVGIVGVLSMIGRGQNPLLAAEARIEIGSLLVTAAVMIVVAMMAIVPPPAILSMLTIRARGTRGQGASGLGGQTRCPGNSCHPERHPAKQRTSRNH